MQATALQGDVDVALMRGGEGGGGVWYFGSA